MFLISIGTEFEYESKQQKNGSKSWFEYNVYPTRTGNISGPPSYPPLTKARPLTAPTAHAHVL